MYMMEKTHVRDYQPQKNNEHYIEHNAYMQTLYFIRGYYARQERHDDLLEESPPPPDGQPRGDNNVDSTASKAERAERYFDDNAIIDQAIRLIPEEYRQGVWNNVMYRMPYPDNLSERHYRRHKGVFVRAVAAKKKFI